MLGPVETFRVGRLNCCCRNNTVLECNGVPHFCWFSAVLRVLCVFWPSPPPAPSHSIASYVDSVPSSEQDVGEQHGLTVRMFFACAESSVARMANWYAIRQQPLLQSKFSPGFTVHIAYTSFRSCRLLMIFFVALSTAACIHSPLLSWQLSAGAFSICFTPQLTPFHLPILRS